MFMLITTLILANFLGIIYTSDSDPITLYNLSITTVAQAVRLVEELAVIKRNEALPPIFFDYIENNDSFGEPKHILQLPENISEAVTVNGKMIKGTKFYSPASDRQILFCPKLNSEDKCLAPKEFEEGQRLRCGKEATPIVKKEEYKGTCGFGKEGIPHSILYEICPSEKPFEYTTREIPLYEFCYDEEKQKILFTMHTIKSPKLLTSQLLIWERNINYPYEVQPDAKTSHYEVIKNSILSESDPLVKAKRPKYEEQKLVPSEDMSLALLRKTTFQFLNVEFQHRELFPLWNKINEFFTKQAILMHGYDIEYYVRTGVFDITPISEDDDQIYNMWVKIIHTTPKTGGVSRGIAVLMNNFIDSETDDSDEDSNLRQTKINTYCEVNLCSNYLMREFEAVKGRVRCCPITEDIGMLFGVQDGSGVDLPPLRVLNLTIDQI